MDMLNMSEFEQWGDDSVEDDGEGECDIFQDACDVVLWHGELGGDPESEQRKRDSVDGDSEGEGDGVQGATDIVVLFWRGKKKGWLIRLWRCWACLNLSNEEVTEKVGWVLLQKLWKTWYCAIPFEPLMQGSNFVL